MASVTDGHRSAGGPVGADEPEGDPALVRLTREVTTGSPYTEPTHHRAGRVLDLWQTGRKEWPIDTTQWITSLDIDLMGLVPDEAVTVL